MPRQMRLIDSSDDLRGETALVRPSNKPGIVLAQFDNLTLEHLAFGWHEFPEASFAEIPEIPNLQNERP